MAGRGRGRKFTPPTGARLQLQKAAEECGFDARNLRSLQSRPDLFPDIELHSSGLPMHQIQQRQEQDAPSPPLSTQGDADTDEGAVNNTNNNSDLKRNIVKTVKRSATTAKLIQKGREMHHRMQASPFYVRFTKDVPDVIRYADTIKSEHQNDSNDGDDTDPFATKDNQTNVVKAVMVHCLGGRKATKQGLFLPDELVYGPKRLTSAGWLNEDQDETNEKSNLDDLEKQEKIKLRRIRLGLENDDEDDNEENEFMDDEFDEQEEQDDGGYGVNYYESEGEESMGDGDGEAYI